MSALIAITMPKWGLTMTEGKVVGWLRQAGESFAAGDELLEIETSKITNVLEADADATLLRVVAPEGSALPIGGLLAVAGPADAPAAEIDAFVSGFVVAASTETEAVEAAPSAPQMLETAAGRLRYLDMGSGGVPVLLLHGFGADLNGWMFNQPALAEHGRVLALDLPGHGGSGKDVGRGDADTMVSAVEAFLATLDPGAVHMVGHSLGGAVAALLAQRSPERVRSLTLIAPAGLGAEINGAFINGFVRAGRRKEAAEVLQMLVHDPSLVSRTMVEDVLRFKRLDGVATALGAIARAWFDGDRQTVGVADALAAARMPVQVIWGQQDRIMPAAHAQAVPAGTPVHVMEGAGHLPHMEKSREVNRLFRRFAD